MEQAIAISVNLPATLDAVRAVLADDSRVLVASTATAEERREHRFHVLLAVDLGAGTKMQQEVLAELEAASAADEGMVVPVRWHPTGHEHLFPTFTGEFVASAGEPGTVLTLRGSYRIPLGWIGRLGDGVAGRKVARRVLRAQLDAAAERTQREVTRRAGHPSMVSGPASLDIGSEYYFG